MLLLLLLADKSDVVVYIANVECVPHRLKKEQQQRMINGLELTKTKPNKANSMQPSTTTTKKQQPKKCEDKNSYL